MSINVLPGVIVERVGSDLMVIVPGHTDVVALSGHTVDVFLDVKDGRKVDPSDPALRDLIDRGIISAVGLSRRGLVRTGALAAGAGIAVLAMPGVAAASSRPGPPPGGTDDEEQQKGVEEAPVQRTQLVGAFTRSNSSNYFYIDPSGGWILDEPSVVAYLDDNGIDTTLPPFPVTLPSEDLGDITELDVPGFTLTAAPGLNNTLSFIEWLASPDVDFTSFDFAVVGYFNWADEDFEVFFFNP